VWFTCEARSSGDFCHQINFQIVKGDQYRFRDSHRESGSNGCCRQGHGGAPHLLPAPPFLNANRRRLTFLKRLCTKCTATTGTLGIPTGDAMDAGNTRQGEEDTRAGEASRWHHHGQQHAGAEGSRQRAEGVAQESLGKARRKVGEFVAGLAKAIKK